MPRTDVPKSGALLQEIPGLVREATIEPQTFNPADNTLEVVWTTGALRTTYASWCGYIDEELDVSPEAVDMSRFDAGAVQVIDSHRVYSGIGAILGVAIRGWIAGGQGRALIKLSQRDELAGIVSDIKAGVIRLLSFGYSVQRYEVTPANERTDGVDRPLYRAVRWTPQEISFVSVPADPGAQTRASTHAASPCEFIGVSSLQVQQRNLTMPQVIVPASGGQAAPVVSAEVRDSIQELCQRHALGDQFAQALIQRGASLDVARSAVLDELARMDRESGGHLNSSYLDHVQQRSEVRRTQMQDALVGRMTRRPVDVSNHYRHARLSDMARDVLEASGVRTSGIQSPQSLIERALHTTSDFPLLIQGAGNRILREAYSVAPGLKVAFRSSTATDFRMKQRLSLGEAPELKKVNEAGEFSFGTMAEAASTYSLSTFGRIFGISRQALVNDDLDAFGDMAARLGRAAFEFENQFLVTLLTSNPTMSDSVALFHASHANLATGPTSVLSMDALSAARKAMRLQKGLDGKTPIDASPKFLIVPAALETTAEQLVAQISPAQSSTVNPFAGRLVPVVDPRLDAVSSTAWYLAADPAVLDTIEYSYLEGEEGPQMTAQQGFEVDGVQMKVRLDFGAGVIDWRGMYKANGA